jgi:surfeit locus 1 family protein
VTLRKWILSFIAIAFALLSVSLGFWQLRRLGSRQQQNDLLAARRSSEPVEPAALPSDTSLAHFRRVRVTGAPDYDREITLTLRVRNGSPGVYIVTPLRRPGTDTAVLINRGWVYAPDGITVDTREWREADSLSGSGFVETFPTQGPFPPANPARPRSFRRLNRTELQKLFPYPIANYYVVLTGSSTSPHAPPRIEPAPLDEGPHRNYAVQWFSFAAISIIGLVIFLRRS